MGDGFTYINMYVLEFKNIGVSQTIYFKTYELAKEYIKTFDVKYYSLKGNYMAIETHENY